MRRCLVRLTLTGFSFVALIGCEPGPATYTDPESGEQLPVPERIRIETDAVESGVVWVEGELYRTSADGPFAAFSTEDASEPEYWYYRSAGVVPLGSRPGDGG